MWPLDKTGDQEESCVEQEADGSRTFRSWAWASQQAARLSGPPSRAWIR